MLAVDARQIGVELARLGACVGIARGALRGEVRQIGRGGCEREIIKEGVAPVALDRDRVFALCELDKSGIEHFPAVAGIEREEDLPLRFAVDEQILRFVGLFGVAEALDIAQPERVEAVGGGVHGDGRPCALLVDIDVALAGPAGHGAGVAEAVLVDLLPCDRRILTAREHAVLKFVFCHCAVRSRSTERQSGQRGDCRSQQRGGLSFFHSIPLSLQ